MNKVTIIKDFGEKSHLLVGGKMHQVVCHLEHAIPWADQKRMTQYVLVSAVDHQWAHETFIFPCDKVGNVLNWIELPGSFGHDYNIDRAIRNLENTDKETENV